jgi:SAM-dependent methyltransferase
MIDESEIHDIDEYFAFQQQDNHQFWTRLGGMPDLTGQRVLDFGCGHGALTQQIAQAGASHVLGVDLDPGRIAYARDRARPLAPDRVEFRCVDVLTLTAEQPFDMIVSKNTFEHVAAVEATLMHLTGMLRPGGRLVLGFSPLYFSPFGDHGELGVRFPWAHLIAGEQRVLAGFNRTNRSAYESLPSAGFNMCKPSSFFAAFDALPVTREYMAVNPAESLPKRIGMALFNVLRRVPVLEPFFTVGIYTILRNAV